MKKMASKALLMTGSVIFLLVSLPCALLARFVASQPRTKPRLVWGSAPIINNAYWSRSMRNAGYVSETYTSDFYATINQRSDWDQILSENYRWAPSPAKPFLAFLHALFRYDVFFISVNGFFLGGTPVRYLQAQLFKIAKKKTVVLPYGSDSYVYRRIRSMSTVHGLLMSYPLAARNQRSIARDVDYWCKHADAFIPGVMGSDGFGRWDALLPSHLFVDLDVWMASDRRSAANGRDETVVIAHAPNHRGFKGSEFVVEAVRELQEDGLKVQLLLLEKIQNVEVRRILREDADILVEQLIVTGHGLNGLEGMASGLPTISNLEDDGSITPWRRWSYFDECPLVSAGPENLAQVLKKLVTRPELRNELGRAGRAYVEKYHGLDSAQYLFANVIDYVYGRTSSLINLYHPLLGDYPKRLPRIRHPLVNSRIVG